MNTKKIIKLFSVVYPNHYAKDLLERFSDIVNRYKSKRPDYLKNYDRKLPSYWYKKSDNIMYVLYADLFCADEPDGGKIKGIIKRLDYFKQLEITNLHILPILETSGDGGFAVDDYRKVDPRFGSMNDLKKLCKFAHNSGIRITLDLVLNHVSDNHKWAVGYKKGMKKYRKYFIIDETGTGKSWGKDVADVFPEFAPGNWDYVPETKEYVWATFYSKYPKGPLKRYNDFAQWDLNYKNPAVLFAMIENILYLANIGVDVFRFDAIPHMWKEKRTCCFALPQNLLIVKLFRAALDEVAPKSAILNEANGSYDEIVSFFSDGDSNQISYNFVIPHNLFYAIVTGNIRPLMITLNSVPKIPQNCQWVVFDVNHDELSLGKIGAKGNKKISRLLVKEFSKDRRALPFGYDPGRDDLPRGMAGTIWSMLGGDSARNGKEMEAVLRKIFLLNAFKLFVGGIPQFYQGEELGLSNDFSFQKDLVKKNDNRFVKRSFITDAVRNKVFSKNSKEAKIHKKIKELISLRKKYHEFIDTTLSEVKSKKTALILVKKTKKGAFFSIFNFGKDKVNLTLKGRCVDLASGQSLSDKVNLDGYSFMLIKRN
ncbi:hypothetical protein JW766_04335 [Candidatus Dojkabacteria bacterium]|nr:hypothetical protein [Candidatus Dojkabacteria bacterium]